MARIAGINIPENKRIEVAMTYIFGIGLQSSRKILAKAKVDPNIRTRDLSSNQIESIRSVVTSWSKIENDLKLEVSQNIKRLKEIGAYRGLRHIKNLPVRGQRTKTNARTKRGKKVTVGSGRKPAAQKT